MGVLRAGFNGTVGQSSAQMVDGSLKFNGATTPQYLKRTLGAGNTKTYTMAYWFKYDSTTNGRRYISTGYDANSRTYGFYIGDNSNLITFNDTGTDAANYNVRPSAVLRDNGWYHLVFNVDTTQSDDDDKVRIYINGVKQTSFGTNTRPSLNATGNMNTSGRELTIGCWLYGTSYASGLEGQIAQFYHIDGQALDASYFGYTDGLTNTWRPKKYTGDFNTPVSFAGSDLLPILNTNSDGSAVTSGTRTDSNNSNWILGLAMNTSANIYTDLSPSDGDATDYSNVTANTTQSKYYGTSAYFNGSNAKLIVNNSRFNFNSTNFTMETWIYVPSTPGASQLVFCSSNPDLIGSSSSAGCLVGWNSSNQLFVYVGSDGTPSINNSAATAVSTGKWHHIAIVKNGGTITLYIDGSASGTTSSSVGNSTSGLYVAHQPANNRWFQAYYQDLRVYTTAKYTSNFSLPVAGVNGFYLPMDGNSPIGKDQSGNGNDFTPVNFGGSLELGNTNVSGARPILNTLAGGKTVTPGVFGSKENLFYTVTTANGSVYQFDITSGNNPSLSFIRGATYRFDYTSHSSHPLRFSSTNPDSSTSAYTDGTNTSVSNVITITVPHNAPDTLYYYCTAHASAMNGSISVTTDETKADLYAWKNTLALPLVGNSSDVSNSVNSGSTTKTITNNGVNISSANSNFYGGSNYWDGGTTDRLTVTYNSEFQFGTGDFCVEFWVNLSTTSGNQYFWDFDTNGGNFQYNSNVLSYSDGVVAGSGPLYSTGITLAVGKWHHLAVTRESSTAKIFVDGVMRATGTTAYNYNQTSVLDIGNGYNNSGYEITGYMQDFRIYKGVAKYTSDFVVPATSPDILPDTPSGVSGGSKLAKVTDGAVAFDGTGDYLSLADSADFAFGTGDFTAECFIYPTANASYQAIIDCRDAVTQATGWILGVDGNDNIYIYNDGFLLQSGSNATPENRWYHVAYVRNSGTHALYVDGRSVATSSSSYNYTVDNCVIGASYAKNGEYWDGFISNVRLVKGTALYTSNFTPPTRTLTNVTNTKLLCCQSNTSAIEGAVKPGTITAAGNAAATNFNPFNTDINTVRGQESGYATLNPLDSNQTLSNGNLICGSSNSHAASRATLSISTGKYYWEVDAGTGWGNDPAVGIMTPSAKISDQLNATGSRWWRFNGVRFYDGTEGSAWSSSVSSNSGKIVGISFDADNGTFEVFIDGISQGFAFTGLKTGQSPNLGSTTSDTWIPATKTYSGSFGINFGQKPFKFPPPDGFQPLNAASLRPETVITRPDHYVEATIYDGNGGTKNVSTNHSPDFVWIKHRTRSQAHVLYDSVRTAGTGKALASNSNGAEGAQSDGTTYGYLSAFNKNGFTVIKGSDGEDYVNKNATGYVAWSWKAGGNKNTFNVDDVGYASAAAAGITEGTISLTGASIGTKQGFSIVSYSGSGSNGTFGHGLLETPNLIIVKCRNVTQNWAVQHSAYGPTKYTYLNSTNGASTTGAAAFWNNTAPTNSTVSVGTDNDTNASGSGRIYIAYCWHDVPGLQKFGSFEGNENANGPFVELGFRPSIILTKNIDNSGTNYDWCIYDNTRSTFNPNDKFLCPNLGNVENVRGDGQTDNARYVDFLSNGFKIRNNSSPMNLNAHTIIYAAWAEAPTFNLYGGQSNAR